MTVAGNGLGGASVAPPIDSSSIKRECIRHTHQNLITIFVSVAIGAAVLLYVLADKIASTHILAWFTAILCWTALRFWFYLAFRRHVREAFDPVFWGGAQSFFTIISGIIWGAAPLAAYPRDSHSEQMFIALIAAGGAAAGTYAYAAMPRTAQAFLAATLFPLVGVNLAMGGMEHYSIGFMLAIYYLMLVIITRNNSRTVRSAIMLALEKTELAEEMEKGRDEADSTAQKLCIEITERKAAEERLKAAKEEAEEATLLRDKFVSLVSHDLKNPLSTVQGFLTMLHFEHDNIGKDEAKAMIVGALEASNGMLHLIDDLLEISRIKTGQLRPRISLTDLHFIADNAAMAYSNFAAGKLIELKNEVPPKTAAYADGHLLLQVLKNLISNAIKFCREGGVVRIYLSQPGTVAVEDTGVGIPPSLLSHIFKYEVKTSTPGTRGEGGTGFGLPLSRDIMKAHGGDLRVESEVGRGSTFYIVLQPPPVF